MLVTRLATHTSNRCDEHFMIMFIIVVSGSVNVYIIYYHLSITTYRFLSIDLMRLCMVNDSPLSDFLSENKNGI